jgi:hypothetical protein
MALETPSLQDTTEFGEHKGKMISLIPMIELFAIIRVGNY